MMLAQLLKKESNNIDLFRLLAAIGVIVGHAYTISPQPPLQDGIQTLLGFDYSGSLAVKFFFFLSGVLVTNSLLERRQLLPFVAARGLRLFPALVVCVLVTVAVSAFMTSLGASEYFRRPETWTYVKENILLRLQWSLPGVFEKNPSSVVNGSLWTLPIEFFCYMFLAALGATRLLDNRWCATLLLLVIAGFLVWRQDALQWFGLPAEGWLMPLFFCFGGALAVNKNSVSIDLQSTLGLFLGAYLLRATPLYSVVMCLALFFAAFYVSSTWLARKIHLPGDYSYGVYLYGFPAQQIAKSIWPEQGVHANQFSGIVLALVLGACSWHWIESPAMRFRRMFRGSVKQA